MYAFHRKWINMRMRHSHKLRGCPECLKLGFHSWMYQHKIIDRCPIHGVKLVDDIDWNLWDDHFKYLPGMNNLNVMPLQNVYDNGFKEIHKIYYQDFFGGIMTDEYVKVSTDIFLYFLESKKLRFFTFFESN